MTKLFLFKAPNVPIVLIVRKGQGHNYQQIHWDLETDSLTPGQWWTEGVGRYYAGRFDKLTGKPVNAHGLLPRTELIECVENVHESNLYPTGLMENLWKDHKGRTITIDLYKIFIDGIEFADFTNNTFVPTPPINLAI